MKSRLFIRALCVGAALLVPTGGLTTFSIATTGATTNQTLQFGLTSTAKLGSIGTAILTGISCPMTATQCTLTSQITITKGGMSGILKLAPVTAKIVAKQAVEI